jgi:hypothetical protein
MSDTDINKPSSSIFHPIAGPNADEQQGKNVRVFVVPAIPAVGTMELYVPGCLKVTSVRIGNTFIPENLEYLAPDSQNFFKKLPVSLPAYAIDRNFEGKAVLRRNPISNDGVWQAGQTVYVCGEWEEDAAAAPASGRKAA